MFLGYNIDVTPLDKMFKTEEPVKDNTGDIVFVTGDTKTNEEAKSEAVPSYENILKQGYAEGLSLPEIRQRATDLGVKTEEMQRAKEYHLEYALSLNNHDVNAAETRLVTNMGVARDMLSQKRFELSSDKSTGRQWYDTTVMFLRDSLPGVSTIEGFTNAREKLSSEIQLAAATMPVDEFKTWFNIKVDEALSKGAYLTANTLSSIDTLESEVNMGGYDVNKNLNFFFSVLDIVDLGAAGAASKAAKNTFRRGVEATTKVGRAAVVEAPETVAEMGARAVERNADPEIAANITTKSIDLKPQPTDIPANVLTRKVKENELVKEIARRNASGAFGRTLTEEELTTLGETYTKRYRNKTTDPVLNFNTITNDLGMVAARIQIGKALPGKPSVPFKYTKAGNVPKSVQKMADEMGGTIVPSTEKTFVIQIDEALNPDDLIGAYNIPDLLPPDISGLTTKVAEKARQILTAPLNNQWIGSSRIRDLEELTTLKQMAEGGLSGVKEVAQEYLKPIQKLSPKSRFTLSRIMSELRDGADSHLRERYGSVEFETKWKQFHPNGTPPTAKDIAAYEAWGALEDADYVFKSYNMYSKAVNKGFTQTIESYDGFFTPAVRVTKDKIPDTAKILDGPSGAKLRKEDFPDDTVFWRHMFTDETGQEFTVAPKTVRAMSPEDILGRNPGGLRTNPRNRFYVIVGDGRQKRRALLGTFSETQARKATEQITNIKNAINSSSPVNKVKDTHIRLYHGGDLSGGKSLEGNSFTTDFNLAKSYSPDGKVYYIDVAKTDDVLEAMAINDFKTGFTTTKIDLKKYGGAKLYEEPKTIDDIVQANNDWNPNVQTVDDWTALGLKVDDGDIHYKRSNGAVLDVVDESTNPFFSDMSTEDFVRVQQSRSDDVIMSYGGGKSYNEDPVNTMLASFGSSINTYTNRIYTSHAIKGWVETAIKTRPEWFDTKISKSDWYSHFVNAKVTGDDAFARKMRELRGIAMRRNGIKDPAGSFMETLAGRFAEFVYDFPLGQNFYDYLTRKGGVEASLLRVAFQSAFGFFNPGQFLVQSYHSIVASIVSMDHLAAAMVIPLRLGHRITDPAALAEWAARKEKFWNSLGANMSKQDWLDLHEYMLTSGRAVVEGDAIEAGTGVGWGLSGWNGENLRYNALKGAMYNIQKYGGMALDKGLMPFNSGERMSRMTAITIAFREFRKKFPNVSPLSNEGRGWITRREQDLTINMTNASRSVVQSGLWKVPTQWLSYTMRAMEAIFVGGKGLSKAERARLFMTMGPMFGLAGFGAESAADYISEKLGIESESAYIALKYGWTDGLSYALTGGDGGFSLGQRLAPVGAIKEVYKKVTEDSTVSAIAGPAGEIAGTIGSSFWDLFINSLPYSTSTGDFTPVTEDLIKVLRQPSGIDSKYKAWSIATNGILRSKSGYVYDSEFTINDAITQLMGVTPIKATEELQRTSQSYLSEKQFRAFARDIGKQAEVAFEYFQGDEKQFSKGLELMKYINTQIEFSGLSPLQQLSLKKSILTPLRSNYQKIQENLIKMDNMEGSKWAERILR